MGQFCCETKRQLASALIWAESLASCVDGLGEGLVRGRPRDSQGLGAGLGSGKGWRVGLETVIPSHSQYFPVSCVGPLVPCVGRGKGSGHSLASKPLDDAHGTPLGHGLLGVLTTSQYWTTVKRTK